MKRTVKLNGRDIEYDLVRGNVKNINLRIKPDLSVRVSAGKNVPVSIIEAFLVSKADRITSALDRFASAAKDAPPPKSYSDGETHNIFGVGYELYVEKGMTDCVTVNGNAVILTVTDPSDHELRRRTFEAWKLELCRDTLREMCENVYPLFRERGIPFPTIRFREMKSRWGSCQPEKCLITLNTRLIGVPYEAAEYVVMHEFVHFLEPNHSKRFYARLSEFMPDWGSRRRLLSECGVSD